MWCEEERQRSFAEQEIYGSGGGNRRLLEIAKLLDWRAIERQLGGVYAAGEGRPAYRPLLMLKALLLQQWYQLSDPALEDALLDRFSFRSFVGLGLKQRVPDHSTISRFRAQLSRGGLGERLMAEVNRQLSAQGLILKQGTIIDATVVRAAVNPPSGPKGTVAPGTKAPQDPDAEWSTRKDGSVRHYYFGYKAHVAVDGGSGLVRKAILTGAKTNETVVADDLICGDEQCGQALHLSLTLSSERRGDWKERKCTRIEQNKRARTKSSSSDPSSPKSPPLSISSTASSNSAPPNSSPISLPIRFIIRATLFGSFSSTSPIFDGSDSDSILDSSLRGIANRDMSRLIFFPPQCAHTASTFSLMRVVRTLVVRRHFSHRYS